MNNSHILIPVGLNIKHVEHLKFLYTWKGLRIKAAVVAVSCLSWSKVNQRLTHLILIFALELLLHFENHTLQQPINLAVMCIRIRVQILAVGAAPENRRVGMAWGGWGGV